MVRARGSPLCPVVVLDYVTDGAHPSASGSSVSSSNVGFTIGGCPLARLLSVTLASNTSVRRTGRRVGFPWLMCRGDLDSPNGMIRIQLERVRTLR